jgi:hypothetical protein
MPIQMLTNCVFTNRSTADTTTFRPPIDRPQTRPRLGQKSAQKTAAMCIDIAAVHFRENDVCAVNYRNRLRKRLPLLGVATGLAAAGALTIALDAVSCAPVPPSARSRNGFR